ncbi:hypothetical protein DL991_27440 [Amycolatopsis sp. WAC 01375]|uniref:hypothetical protein n=1 Tax=unclassified Amycolatopsis TaxID=2618356 RepID=UPI000F7A7EF7|nr:MULTISPECIES: hypothetical protein [unclassified Amycolatopsis]RSM75426.1 hypothetical protein DL991_27440 [Amycolatopsis sp. WAC 01375]RSN24788.1 hypothetical protein DL990_33420 [Amycolatopsis sp. WAC 01416]
MADSGDIKITVSFLKDFQSGVLEKMVTELEENKYLAELQLAANNPTGKRRLLAGAEAWEPAKLLMEKYEGKAGTAPTLWAQVDVIQKRLVRLSESISDVLRVAENGENENIKLSTELNMSQLGEILGVDSPPPTGNGGNGGTGV